MPATYPDLAGKVAVVAGGAGGIGARICLALRDNGARVVVVDIDADRAAAVARSLSQPGATVTAVAADLGEMSAVAGMMRGIAAEQGGIDILVHAAGISPKSPEGKRLSIWDISQQDWRRTMAVNLDSVFFCAVEAARCMRPRGGGTIVNISSVVARICTGYATAAYVATRTTCHLLKRNITRSGLLNQFCFRVFPWIGRIQP